MSAPVRIAHVNVARGYRGGERQTELLVRELAQRGHSQVLVARRGAPLPDRLADLDIEIRLSQGNPLATFARTGKVDIVHVHEGRSSYAAWLRYCVSGTPYVITRRVDNPLSRHFLAHTTYRKANFVVAIAPDVERLLQQYDAGIHTTRIPSSSSGFVVNDEFRQKIRDCYAGKFLVGHVGALDNHQKGQEYIIDAAAALATQAPEIHFLLVGGGADEARLRETIASRRLQNIGFTGFVDNVGDYLAAFDIFVMPSNFEALGSVLLDAMIQRLPIVASRVGGIPSLIQDEDTGLLIEPRRPDQLRDAILRLRNSGELRLRLGEAAFERARDYTPVAMCDAYEKLYRQVLEPDRKTP